MDNNALQTWMDKQEISETLHKYPIALDRLDRELLLSIGHPEGHVDFEKMFQGTWPAFVEWVLPVHKALLFHNHRITNMLVEFADDGARSETNVTATLLVPQQSGEVDERRIQARYLDKWTRYRGHWLIAERRLVRDLRRTTRISATEFKERYVIDTPRY